MAAASGAQLHVEVSGVRETSSALADVEHSLEPSSATMRRAASSGADRLAAALRSAAAAAPTPQSRLVAETIRRAGGLDAGVELGGAAPVGSRGTPARDLVAGAEHGGRNFAAARSSGGYWISPTVEHERSGATRGEIQRGVDAAIADGGF